MNNVVTVLTNAIVLTMDEAFHQYDPGAVAILGDSITAVGPAEEIEAAYPNSERIDCGGKILMPGLVNAHTHVPMTLLRGLADDRRLDVWLLGYMMPVEREFVSPDFVKLGTKLACAELIRSGVTAFADMYYFEDSVAEGAVEAGMRALCAETVMKYPTPDSPSYEEALEMTRAFIEKYKGNPLIVPAIGPHAPYTCTDEILQACAALAIEYDVPIHIHISETAAEVENMRNEIGMPVVPYVKKQNLLDAKVLAAHCVHIDEGEMRTLKNYRAGVAHNPSSNLKLASGIAPVRRMLELGVNVGIGTDGPASNNDLDMFEEMRLTAFLAKGSSGDPTAIPARTAMLMATRLGAKAMHMGDITGSLEVGKRADLILVDIQAAHNAPRFRRDPEGPYIQVVYASKSTDVTDVMINGQWVMRAQKLLTLDEAELMQAAQVYAQRIDQFLHEREGSVLSKLIAIGGATQEQSFEVQAKLPVEDIRTIQEALHKADFEIIRTRHYKEYDVYFLFEDPEQGRIRYREDHFVEPGGEISTVRSRLTHIGQVREYNFPEGPLLSRSRYLAPAQQPLRFYREYFQPQRVLEIEKERLRYLIRYNNTEFFINIDTVKKPPLGKFVEIKSRTWSRRDAEQKSRLVTELLNTLGLSNNLIVALDYVEMLQQELQD